MPRRGGGSTLDLTRYLRRPDPNAGAALLAAMLKKDEEASDKALQEGMAGAAGGLMAAAAGATLPVGETIGTSLPVEGPYGFDPTLVTEPPGTPMSLPMGSASPRTAAPAEGGFDWQRLAAGVADVLGSAGGRNPNYSGQLAKSRAAAAKERRLAEEFEREYALKTIDTFSKLNTAQTNNLKTMMETVALWAEKAPGATEGERVEAVDTFRKRFNAIGTPMPEGSIQAMVRVPGVAELVGGYAPFLQDPEMAGRLGLVLHKMYFEKKDTQIPGYLNDQLGPLVRHETAQVFGAMAQALKGDPAFAKEGIVPYETVVDTMGAIPGKGRAYQMVLGGQLGATGNYKEWLDTLKMKGVGPRPDETAAARKAGAVRTAERGAEAPFETPRLDPGTLAELARAKIDPRKATQEQIAVATGAAEDRAVAFEKRKASARQAVENDKPLTEQQRTRLRLDYREEARRVVLSTEPGGIFGALERLEPEQKKAIEDRIAAKAVELADADGLGTLFKGAARRPSAPPGVSLPSLRWDLKRKMLVPAR